MVDSETKKVFVLDDNKAWLDLIKHTIIPHFSLRNVEFVLMTTEWREMLDHSEVSQASLFIIDYFLKNTPVKSRFPSLDMNADITGMELAMTCKTLAPNAKVKIVTCGQSIVLEALSKNSEFLRVCEPKDIINKPLTLEVMKSVVKELS